MALSKRDQIKLNEVWRYGERVNKKYAWDFVCDCITDLKRGIQRGTNKGTQEDINELHRLWEEAIRKHKEAS